MCSAESVLPAVPDLSRPGGPAHTLELAAPGSKIAVHAAFHVLNPTDEAWDWEWQHVGTQAGTAGAPKDSLGGAFLCKVMQGRAAARARCQMTFTFTAPSAAPQVTSRLSEKQAVTGHKSQTIYAGFV